MSSSSHSPENPPRPGHVVIHRAHGVRAGWHTLREPSAILRAECAGDVAAVLREAGRATASGKIVAGYVAYEAAPAFDSAFATRATTGPLAWFGVYAPDRVLSGIHPPGPFRRPAPVNWRTDITRGEFTGRVARVREAIAAGETYQVNLTHRLVAPMCGDAWSLFVERLLVQPVPHAAFFDTGDTAVCSWSPELFFHLEGSRITCRPMKGTAAADSGHALLAESAKDRAENLMIVDMIRNDMGRVARTGTVRSGPLFSIEDYATVQQMTSTVTAETDADWTGVFTALFPCASITGAPKVQTMKIIRRLEDSPRGLYTGAAGVAFGPQDAEFNVAIRTAVVRRAEGSAEYGVGSGVVWDSSADGEWEECGRKTAMLETPAPDFQLLETLRWTPEEGYALLDGHLDRMLGSVGFFGFSGTRKSLREALQAAAPAFPRQPMRVRFLLAGDGTARVESSPLGVSPTPLRVALDDRPVSTDDLFLFHKTTRRGRYEQALARRPGVDDILLWNARGMACEFTIGNLAVLLDGQWVTPPVGHGLLPGVQRAHEIESGRLIERPIPLSDLRRAEAIERINSVRGRVPVILGDADGV